mmetsp:Transcript_35242/g.88823  ORF Transcript_35242/g.88823 Transcript_35242/m.88823 type:complete len:216 (+) Transcript_35242:290-937(+)
MPIAARVALRSSPTSAAVPSGGGTRRCDHIARGKYRVFGPLPFSAFCPIKKNKPTDCSSNLAGSKRPPSPVARSRPPEGATQKMCPPSLKSRCISVTVSRLRADLASFSFSSKVFRYFFEKMVSKFLPMLKGMAKGSVVTLWPATNIVFSARSPWPCSSKRRERTCGSASVWWFASKTTFSPAARESLMLLTCSRPSTRETRYLTIDRKKSLPHV